VKFVYEISVCLKKYIKAVVMITLYSMSICFIQMGVVL
jgi:hypothetical protein